MSRWTKALVLIACVPWFGCSWSSCGEPSRAPRLVVLGVDGLDHRMLDAMVAAGELPAFAELYERGSVGRVDVRSAGMPPLSPRVWTSFVTGYHPRVHGIKAFVYKAPDGRKRLTGSRQRTAAAIWDIAVQRDLSVGVVNWFCSYPAEPVRGFVVSDRLLPLRVEMLAEHRGAEIEHDADLAVHPPQLGAILSELMPVAERPEGVTLEDAEAFDRLIFEVTAKAREHIDVDVLLVYTRSLDDLSHLYWNTHEPLPGEPTPTHDAVADYLRSYDRMLAAFLRTLSPQSHFVLLSDHGFERHDGFPPGRHVSPATAAGVFIASGPRIRRGVRMADADALDVLPTLLEMVGIPADVEMPGKVHDDAFLEDDRQFLERVPAYVRQPPSVSGPDTSVADDAIRERLRNLGYEVD